MNDSIPKALTIDRVVGSSATQDAVSLKLCDAQGRAVELEMNARTAYDLAWRALQAGHGARHGSEGVPSMHFPCVTTAVTSMFGNNAHGNLMMFFTVPDGVGFSTEIGPQLTVTLANQLNAELARMPVPPPEWDMIAPIKGKTTAKETVTYFGQSYPAKIVELLGIIIIRANLLEQALVGLLKNVADVTTDRAMSIFYSSQNNKARLDLIRNLLSVSGLTDILRSDAQTHLDRVQAISNRRNLLVHGVWEFKKDKFVVQEARATPQATSQNTITTYKSLLDLASSYHDEAVMMLETAHRIERFRMAANNDDIT